jgi:hypothetical protein
MNASLTTLPDDLPAPADDGAADHIEGPVLPRSRWPDSSNRLPRVDGVITPTFTHSGRQHP